MMKLFAKIVNGLLTFLTPWYARGWNIVVTSGLVYGILLARLGWCPQLLLGIVRQTTKTDMQDCWSFTCYFYWTLAHTDGILLSRLAWCMEYCCHVWADAPSCYLELLGKLKKRICRTVGPSLCCIVEMWPP